MTTQSPATVPTACHDRTCPQRHDCMMWNGDDPVHPQWAGFSLFPVDLPLDHPCPWFADREAA